VSFPTPEGEGDIETLVCPYVAPVNGFHYYSCTHKPLVYHYLTSEGPSGPDDDTHNFTELTTEFESVTSEFRTPVIITGTIVDVELEGGFIGIEAGTDENPQNYIAVNIQDELAVHIGKEINITSSYTRSDIVGTEMWGEYLYVETYEIVEPINFTELTTEFESVTSEFRTPVIITGTIVDVELEGGFIGIEAGTDENPQNYIAVNIQDELAVHIGKEINITSSYTRSDIVGTEMWGEYLYVETYEIVEPILCVDTTNSVTISNSKYILNNGDTYGKFGLNIGKYTFVVPPNHPIYLVGNNTDQIDISSDEIRPMGQDGYTGNVVITVYEDFGTISYACSSHGPMGGTNNLVFDASCPMGEVATPTPEPILNHPFEELTTQYIESELEFRTPIMLTGTVVNVELEGGFIGIQAGTNENPEYYVPINIQDELANSVGKEILVTDSFLRSDWIGVEMWGTYLYVSDYEIVQPVQECFEDFGNVEISVTGDNEAYSINGVTFNSDINGTFRFKLGSGVTIPSVYLCSLNGVDVSFKITSTSKVFENTFMFKDNEGVVYKGSLTNNSFSGTSDVNNFVEYNCGELFSVNSVELKDIYTKSQPIYEVLVSDGEYLSGIQFNNFKVNSESPLYLDVFPDFTTQSGYGYEGGYSSKVYGIAIHKSNAYISDNSLIMCIESVFSNDGETNTPYGTTAIGKVNELSELETLTNENTQVSYLKSLDSSNYGGLLYSNNTTLNIMVVDENDRVGLVDKEKFNEWRGSEELSATLFIYNETNNAESTIIHRQAFAIDDISGSTTSTIESLEIPVNFTTGENTSESTVTLKPEQDATITSSTFHIDVCADCNITTPSVYLVSAKNNSSDSESVADVKVTLTSEVVRSRVELKIGGDSYFGHLVKLSDGGVNELLTAADDSEFIQFTKYQTSDGGGVDSYERVDAWPGTEYFEIYATETNEVWLESFKSDLGENEDFTGVVIILGTCSSPHDLSTFTAGPEAPGVIIKNATATDFEIYIPGEVYTIKTD
jgi:hypothetical protein